MTDDEKLDKKDRRTLQSIVRPIIAGAEQPTPPFWIATKAMEGIDPLIAYTAGHYAFREVSRTILRENGSSVRIGERPKQLELQIFNLIHDKYPKPDGSGYVFVESMTDEEGEWNASQLEKFGRAAIAHAQQLRRYLAARRTAA